MEMSICLCLELESKDIQFITYIKEKHQILTLLEPENDVILFLTGK